MENGKPTGPKPKWWSRPGRATPSEPDVLAAEAPVDGTVEPAPAAAVDDRPEYPLAAPAIPSSPSSGRPDGPEGEERRSAGIPAARSGDAPTDDGAFLRSEAGGGAQQAVPAGPDPGIPAADRQPVSPDGTAPAPETAAFPPRTHPAAPGHAAAPAPTAMQPLHQPDEFRTPPYGGPGPWAPAPPVQRPVGATPAQGTRVPEQHPTAADGYAATPPAAAPAPVPVQWTQYDPWSTPGATGATLTRSGEPPRKNGRRGMALAGALAFALVTAVLGGAVGAYVERNGGITSVELPQSGPEDAGRAPDSVAGIAASALPSVVTLHVSGSSAQGTGTGFVLDAQGHILTNNHVVSPAGSNGDISITFSGGETARATLVGKDSGYDLAVVKVTGVSGLKPLPLGNSDNVRVGDPVVAIGAPFDLQNTVTAGIISAKERPITAGGEKGDGSDVSYVDALQTDAPINPGNSGGPLVDSKARVIGINSAIRAADTGAGPEGSSGQAGSIGLGFAIPINQGKRVAEELINTGKATHPVIGVSLDMKYTGDGARVGEKGKDGTPSVTVGGPAAKAGVRAGDVITKVDGQRVHSGEELIVKIRAHRPADRLELTLVRNGKEQTKTLTLGSSTGT
ncbi:trypsin-like peptidase domain-containing protein [Streptomyces sp. NPDC059176]|uniref:trypsin-like peptidase domain-containing protein n=1 Tax=unclassified Streptomyces TaxID=2593676 RepID=UPI0036C9328F